MEVERAFLLDKQRRLEARLREIEQLGARLREIQQLEAQGEEVEELFADLETSFYMWHASSSLESKACKPSCDDDSGNDMLQLPPSPAIAEPDPAVTSVTKTCIVGEEWPYRPALSLRKPPVSFPHPVVRQWLGCLTRDSLRAVYVEAALPQLPGGGGHVVVGLSCDPSPVTESSQSPSSPLFPPWSWDWGGWPDINGGRTLMDKHADLRGWPATGLWDSGWKPPGVRYSLSGDSAAVSWRPRRGEPPDTGAPDGLEPYILQALEWMHLDSLGLECRGNET
jgi:hypothetical protein